MSGSYEDQLKVDCALWCTSIKDVEYTAYSQSCCCHVGLGNLFA